MLSCSSGWYIMAQVQSRLFWLRPNSVLLLRIQRGSRGSTIPPLQPKRRTFLLRIVHSFPSYLKKIYFIVKKNPRFTWKSIYFIVKKNPLIQKEPLQRNAESSPVLPHIWCSFSSLVSHPWKSYISRSLWVSCCFHQKYLHLCPTLGNSESAHWTSFYLQSAINPLMLTAAKSSLTILMIICRQKQSQENIWSRNVNQNITNNSPSNIL